MTAIFYTVLDRDYGITRTLFFTNLVCMVVFSFLVREITLMAASDALGKVNEHFTVDEFMERCSWGFMVPEPDVRIVEVGDDIFW